MLTEQGTASLEKLRSRLGSISNLPTPPVVFNQITKIINNPKTSVNELADIMSEDAAMSAKVLRLSNSAFYGARSEITGIKQAVLVLGLESIKSLVLSSSVIDMFKPHKLNAEFQEDFWRHSLATALASRIVTKFHRMARGLDSEVAFSAGLLHDIGKLIICCFFKEEHEEIELLKSKNNISDYQAETTAAGFSHTLIGKVLAENWKLPAAISDAIEHHHFPDKVAKDGANYAVVVHIANYLSKKAFDRRLREFDGWHHLQPEIVDDYNLTDEVIEAFCQQLLEDYARSNTFMQMVTGDA